MALSRMSVDGSKERTVDLAEEGSRVVEEEDANDRVDVGIVVVVENADTIIEANDERPSILNFDIILVAIVIIMIARTALNR